jgi:uncharacterized protein (DUF2461 family)
MKHLFKDITKVAFNAFGRQIVFSEQFTYLKYHVTEFVQAASLYAQDVENDFLRPFDTLKQRFIDSSKSFFQDFQKAYYDFSAPINDLKHEFHDFVQIFFFWMPKM